MEIQKERDDEEHVSHHVALTTRTIAEKSKCEDDPSNDPADAPAHDNDNSNEEELTNEVIVTLYKAMYQKWLEVVKFNERLTKQVAQLKTEKDDLLKRNMLLEGDLVEKKKILKIEFQKMYSN